MERQKNYRSETISTTTKRLHKSLNETKSAFDLSRWRKSFPDKNIYNDFHKATAIK
jgi:hypothetical protein